MFFPIEQRGFLGSRPHHLIRRAFAASLGIAIFLSVSAAHSRDYFVRPDGNDGNTGTSNSSAGAWRSVSKCTSVLVAGDTCYVQPGTYYSPTRIVETTSGSFTDNNASGCTCTKGSTTATCATNAGRFSAGEFFQCDTGYGFFFTEVASVNGNTITLTEPYPGPTSTTPGSDTADELRPIRYVGARGTTPVTQPTDVRITMFTGVGKPSSFTQNGTYSHVYQYDTTGQSGVWAAPTAIREAGTTSQTWDDAFAAWDLDDASRYPSGKNGLDSYYKFPSSTNCPCNRGSVLQNVADVAGSWGIDGTTVYIHTYNGADPDTLNMEASDLPTSASNHNLFAIEGNNIIVQGMTFETESERDTESGNAMYGVYQGPAAKLRIKWKNILINGQFVWLTNATTGVVDVLFEDFKSLSGMNSSIYLNVVEASGLRWNRVEVRGGHNSGWGTKSLSGASSSDPVVVDGLYLHRTRTDIINAACGASPDWFDCSTTPVTMNAESYSGSHGLYLGSAAAPDWDLKSILIQNCIIETTYDGLGLFAGGLDTGATVRNCTFGRGMEYLLIGDSYDPGTSASFYNNVWLRDEASSGGGRAVQMYFDVTADHPTSDYNAMVINDARGVNVLTSQPFWRKQVTPNTDYDLAEVRATFLQERSSLIVCDSGDSGCQASAANRVYAVASPFGIFVDSTISGGTDYTPVAGSPLIDAGSGAQCPETDFYGNPRDDGACDIGAIEYQGNPPDTTPPSPVTSFSAADGGAVVSLAWRNSASTDNLGTLVRVRSDRAPSSTTDGNLVCRRDAPPSSSDGCEYVPGQVGQTYYFTAFSYDRAGNYGQGVSTSGSAGGTDTTPPGQVPPPTRTDKK